MLVALILPLVAGCNPFPTAAPIAEQRWRLAVGGTSLSVNDFLPDSELPFNTADACSSAADKADIITDENGVKVSVDPICRSWNFPDLCPNCRVGLPKPAFKASRDVSWTFPEPYPDVEIVAVAISGGVFELSLSHSLSFTPFRAGELKVIAQSLGGSATNRVEAVLREDVDPGTPVTVRMNFDADQPITFTDGIKLTFEMDAKADTLNVDFSQASSIDVRARVDSLTVHSVTLRLKGKTIELPPGRFDTSSAGNLSDVTDRIIEAGVDVVITNPFALSAEGTVTLGQTVRSIEIKEGATSEISVSYSGTEIASFLGGEVAYALSARFSDGEVTLTASDSIAIKVLVDATLRTEPSEGRSGG